ncbi:MAG: cytochrome c3 family protein [Bacillota bacterium]
MKHCRTLSHLLPFLVVGVLLVSGGLVSRGNEKSANVTNGVAVLYPADEGIVEGNVTLIMVVAPASKPQPTVSVDGKAVGVERMAFSSIWTTRLARISPASFAGQGNPAATLLLKDKSDKVMLVAAVSLDEGRHVIDADGTKVSVFRKQAAGSKATPEGWSVFHTHQAQTTKDSAEALACERCHTMSRADSGRVLGTVKVPGSCEECHSDVDLQLIHRHVLDSLSKCHTCHDPHGSTRAKLLVDDQEKLCTRCHEGGHSKM